MHAEFFLKATYLLYLHAFSHIFKLHHASMPQQGFTVKLSESYQCISKVCINLIHRDHKETSCNFVSKELS